VLTGLIHAMGFVLSLNGDLWTLTTFAVGLSFRLLAIRYRWNMPTFVYVGSKREYSGSATALHNANTVRIAPRRRTSARCSNGALRRDHQLARRPSAPPFRDLPLRGHNRKPAAVSRP
jgi:hypothetical protein